MKYWRRFFSIVLFFLAYSVVFSETSDDAVSSSEVDSEYETEEDEFDFDSFIEDSSGDESGSSASSGQDIFKVDLSGSLHTGGTLFINDFKTFFDIRASSLIWGDLNLHAEAPMVEGFIGLKLSDTTLPFNLHNKAQVYPRKPQIPPFIDEAYLQIMKGPVVFSGGIKKITWGKADAFSVLDIVNAQDLSNPTVTDPLALKIGKPMFTLSAYLPKEVKLDFMYSPIFEGNKFALDGRWKPNQFEKMEKQMMEDLKKEEGYSIVKPFLEDPNLKDEFLHMDLSSIMPAEIDSAKISYSQFGMRLTSIIAGAHDLGFQYYFGRLPNPALKIDREALTNAFADIKTLSETNLASDIKKIMTKLMLTTNPEELKALQKELFDLLNEYEAQIERASAKVQDAFGMDYNTVHQLGIDYSTAVGVVNLRAELAANITNDLSGDNPAVYNPSMAWHFGMDYTAPFGTMFNLGVSENIKLMHKKIGTKPYDIEKGAPITDTKIMFRISHNLLRGELELALNTIMACETIDFFMTPTIGWSRGSLSVEGGFGFFFGKADGVLSQYKNNNFIHLSVGYKF